MQTLGLADSTPRTEGRLKTLFWPSVRSQGDVELLTNQGFWICTVVAGVTLVISFFQPKILLNVLSAAYFFAGGVGIRCRSRFAAVSVFLGYLLSTAVVLKLMFNPFSGGVILRVLFLSLLLANVRAIWLSARLPAAPKAYQDQLAASASFSDRFPKLVWPWLRWVFYIWSIPWIALSLVGAILFLMVRR